MVFERGEMVRVSLVASLGLVLGGCLPQMLLKKRDREPRWDSTTTTTEPDVDGKGGKGGGGGGGGGGVGGPGGGGGSANWADCEAESVRRTVEGYQVERRQWVYDEEGRLKRYAEFDAWDTRTSRVIYRYDADGRLSVARYDDTGDGEDEEVATWIYDGVGDDPMGWESDWDEDGTADVWAWEIYDDGWLVESVGDSRGGHATHDGLRAWYAARDFTLRESSWFLDIWDDGTIDRTRVDLLDGARDRVKRSVYDEYADGVDDVVDKVTWGDDGWTTWMTEALTPVTAVQTRDSARQYLDGRVDRVWTDVWLDGELDLEEEYVWDGQLLVAHRWDVLPDADPGVDYTDTIAWTCADPTRSVRGQPGPPPRPRPGAGIGPVALEHGAP